MAAYATAAQVMRLSYAIAALEQSGKISDYDIEELVLQDANPVIDAALYGLCTVPMATAPALISAIAARLGAAAVFENYLSHRDDLDTAWGGTQRKRAMEMLEKIQKGELSLAEVTTSSMVVISDPTDDRPETEVFTGDETLWTMRTETRE